ncbi:MAG: metal ABC transporter permease [Candidatus Dormiibacterota bacterium]
MPDQGASWDLLADLQLLLQFHFMQNALIAGTLVALLAGAAGYFVVLRGQSFVAHMLSQVGFPGAAAAVLLGLPPVLGLIAFCLAAALGIGWMGRDLDAGHRAESAAVGSILAFSLGLGLLFFRLYAGSAQGIYGFLFGTILGISDRDVQVTLAVAIAGIVALAVIARPLVFASVDPDVAETRGVPVRALSLAFLLILAFAVAITVQIVGTLLIFALLVTPGAAALQLTARPARGLWLSIGLSLAFTWAGLALAYFSDYPVGFFITSLAFGTYVAIRAAKLLITRFSNRVEAPALFKVGAS